MRCAWLPLGAGVVLAVCGPPGRSRSATPAPGLTVEYHDDFYAVTGSTPEALAAAMRRFGPEVGGKRVPGATRQEISWDYRVARRGPECTIRRVDVHVSITTTLPQWQDSSDAPTQLRERWSAFVGAVRQHEMQHERINLEGAHHLVRRLKAIKPLPCSELQREVTRTGEASLQLFADRNAKYDRETQGGQTEGVVWPPTTGSSSRPHEDHVSLGEGHVPEFEPA